eukprot:6334490-Heterocapsa_arctica.AAC.1
MISLGTVAAEPGHLFCDKCKLQGPSAESVQDRLASRPSDDWEEGLMSQAATIPNGSHLQPPEYSLHSK